MRWWEMQAYIKGMSDRSRSVWESGRLNAWVLACVQGAKIDSPEDMYPLKWDKAREARKNTHEPDADELALIEKMREEAREWNKEHGF